MLNVTKDDLQLWIEFWNITLKCLPNNKIRYLTKLKGFTKEQIKNVVQMMFSVIDSVESIVGKGENAV